MVKTTEQDSPQEILEQGHIYFAYRPKVRAEGDDEEVAAEGSATCRTSTSCSSRTAAASA